jgi:hypothetical protein
MLPAPLDRSVIETLGPVFLKSYQPCPRYGYRQQTDCMPAQCTRAAELGVEPPALTAAVIAFTRYTNRVRNLTNFDRKLMKRGYAQDAIIRIGHEYRLALAQRPPELDQHVFAARDFERRVMSVPIQERRLPVYAKRFADLYPGRRAPKLRHAQCPDARVDVDFVDSAADAGGYGSGYLRRQRNAGKSVTYHYSVTCRLRVSKADCPVIFGAGIANCNGKVAVAAREAFSDSLPAGFRAFEAVWVSAGLGYRVNAQRGVILKTSRGGTEHHADMDLTAALAARAQVLEQAAERRAKAVKPFRFSKARHTVADRLARDQVDSARTGDLFGNCESRFDLDF